MKTAFSFFITALAQLISGLGGLALATVLGWIGGASLLGSFTVLISMIGLFGMISRRGQGSLLTRAVAWSIHSNGYNDALILLIFAIRRVIALCFVLGIVGSAVILSGMFGNPFPGASLAFPLALLFSTILALFAGYARGSGRPWLAPFFEVGGISSITGGFLFIAMLVWSDLESPAVIVGLLLSMTFLIAVALMFCLRDYRGGSLLDPSFEQRKELQVGEIPFTLIAISSYLIQSGSFLLAAPFLSEGDLGLLRAAERLALLVSFPVLAVIPVIAPRVVRLYRTGENVGLKRLMAISMVVCGGIAGLVLLCMLAWPERALALIGQEFESAASFLKIMAIAHFVAATFGPLIGLLHSSGRERVSMYINLGTLAVALVLVPVMTVSAGPYGFSVAYGTIIALRLSLIAGVVLLNGPIAPGGQEATK